MRQQAVDRVANSAGGCFADFEGGVLPLHGQRRQFRQPQARQEGGDQRIRRKCPLHQADHKAEVGHGVQQPGKFPDPGRAQAPVGGRKGPPPALILQSRMRPQMLLQATQFLLAHAQNIEQNRSGFNSFY